MTDPRTNIEHSINIGQVYVDDRTGDLTKVIYLDEDVSLMRDEDGHHRIDSRSNFDTNVGSGRFKLAPDEEFGYAGRMEALLDAQERYSSKDGRTSDHKAEALSEAVSLLTEETSQFEEVEFETVSGIGDATAGRLRSSGYTTVEDIERASDDELLSVGGVGEGNLSNMRAHVESLK